MQINLKSIGTIHTPFERKAGMPVQPVAGKGVRGTIEILPEYAEAMRGLDGFSYVTVLFYLDRSLPPTMLVVTPYDDEPHGLFSTRTPNRPNPIGLSIVRVLGVEGCTLLVEDLDMLDGTPLLDIKPFVPAIDHRQVDKIGWFEGISDRIEQTRLDASLAAAQEANGCPS